MRLFIGTALLILATFFVEPDPMRSPLGHYPEMDYSGAIYTLWYEYEVEEQDDQYLPEDGEVYFALLNENGELASQEVTTKRGNSFVFDCPDISACRVVTDVDYKTHEGTYWQLDGRMADTGLLTGRFRRYSGTNAYQIAYTARHKQDLSFLIGIMAISVIIWILYQLALIRTHAPSPAFRWT